MNIGIIGMGPIGFELANILSKFHRIDMFDMLSKTKVLGYVNNNRKIQLLDILKSNNISLTYEKKYDPLEWTHQKIIYCIGTRPNILTSNFIINNNLQIPLTNIYIGGDCTNTPYIKTGQMAYQQGMYVAKRLNGDIPLEEPFRYKHNGMSLNLGYKKILIEDHNIIPDGIYPDTIIKLYSLFFV
jgi:NADH dehydrogenase FAD-containing subunit